MNEEKQPGISFDSIILKTLEFNRKPNVDNKPELDVDIKYGKTMTSNNEHLVCELGVSIKQEGKTKEESSFVLNCSMIGTFSTISKEMNMDLNEFAEINAAATMFPYLRAVVTEVTIKGGLKPVILAPINFVSLLKKNESPD
jgi:preprotein translocase subunit SecB